MTIKPENLELIKNMRKDLRSYLFDLHSGGLDKHLQLITQVRQLRQFLIALSIAIVGVTFPQFFIQNINTEIMDYIIISLILFSLVIILGLITLIPTATQEEKEMPLITKHHIEEILKTLNELNEIEKIENNNEAGNKLEELKKKSHALPMKNSNILEQLWAKYVDVTLLSLFLVGFLLLLMSLFKNINILI